MKKIYLSLFSLFLVLSLSAQVNITYQVDITDYLAAGNTLAAEGIRVGGDFTTQSGTNGGAAIPDWTPSDANSAMTDMGGNLWSITVTYPAGSIGATQQYKFVNGDWGMNEGTDTTLIADDGCGVDDGAGNINRTLDIPDADMTLTFCWDACAACGASSVADLNAIADFSVAPNPTRDNTLFTYTLNSQEEVNISIYNLLGTKVASVYSGTLDRGTHTAETNLGHLSPGIYLYQIQVGNNVAGGKLMKK